MNRSGSRKNLIWKRTAVTGIILATMAAPLIVMPTRANADPTSAVDGGSYGPVVTIVSPEYADVVKGTSVSIDVAVQQRTNPVKAMQMFVDDHIATPGWVPLTSLQSSKFNWDTTLVNNGPHQLTLRVIDSTGMIGQAKITVYVNNVSQSQQQDATAPALKWLALQNGQVLKGVVDLQLQATGNFGVKYIFVMLNSVSDPDKKPALRSWMINQPPYIIPFDTTKVNDGAYVLDALAYDGLPNQGEAPRLSIEIANNTIAPTYLGSPSMSGDSSTSSADTTNKTTNQEPVTDSSNSATTTANTTTTTNTATKGTGTDSDHSSNTTVVTTQTANTSDKSLGYQHNAQNELGQSTKPQIAFLPKFNSKPKTDSLTSITVSPVSAKMQASEMSRSWPAVYQAKQYERLPAIAQRYGLPVEVLAKNNGLKNSAILTVGQKINMPRNVQVTYLGKALHSDVNPILVGTTSVAAFRFLFEAQGGKVDWDPTTRTVHAKNSESEVTLTIGSNEAVVNQKTVLMDLAAFLLSGRTMVPVRLFEKSLNAQVTWDPSTGRMFMALASKS